MKRIRSCIVLLIALLMAIALIFGCQDNDKNEEAWASLFRENQHKDNALSFLENSFAVAFAEIDLMSEVSTESYIIEICDGIYTARNGSVSFSDISLSKLISVVEEEGSTIEFVNVFANESLNFEKSVTLKGTLTMKGTNLNLNRNTVLEDFCFFGERASIRVKDGVTYGISGEINSVGSSAVILDYSSGARFVANGVDIESSFSYGAIVCDVGSVEVYSGNISNAYGVAIENRSTFSILGDANISGLNFDIITDKPITLSKGESKMSSEISVMYRSCFEKGSFSVVFRGADRDMLTKVTLYDASGEEISLEYFEISEYTEEKNILAVYLPYSLKFYSDGLLYSTEYFLHGEIPREPEEVKKQGYSFCGWYKDTSFSQPYNFASAEYSDFSLYASFKLTAPEFSISSMEFSYDGQKRLLGFDYLYHPLSDKGQFSFVWYKDSEPIKSSGQYVQISNVDDSGSYYCKLTFSYCGDFVTVNTPEVSVKVDKKIITKPEIEPVVYNGYPISPNISLSEYYEYEAFGETNVGLYFIELRLLDFKNCKWSDCETETTLVEFEIRKAQNLFLEQPVVENIYENEEPRVKYTLKFGYGRIEFSSDLKDWVRSAPNREGTYYLRVVAEETSNYSEALSEIVEFTVYDEICIGIKIEKNPTKTVYRAFERVDLSGAEFIATYNSGRSEKISSTLVNVKYKNGNCFVVTDSSATIVFSGNSVPLPVTVVPCEYDLSALVFENGEQIFNGMRHTIDAVCNVVGEDNIALQYKISGGGINVGEYEVTISFATDSINYVVPESITRTLKILPLSVSAVYSDTEFVYDGMPKAPTVTIFGAQGVPVSFFASAPATDVGTYTLYVSVTDKNYVLTNPNIEFAILKADFDLSGINWNESNFKYDGEIHNVYLSGLPSGITVVGYANSSFTEAGNYIAEASVSYDEKNYNAPPKLTHEWKIERIDYDMSGCVFSDVEAVYDGNYHYPTHCGTLPMGLDGIVLEYSFSEGAKHVSDGNVAVTVTFESSSKNYNTPSPITLYVTILPKPIEIEWGELSFIYNGSEQNPIATSEECIINVTGGGINAGEYVATAQSESSDYEIVNPEVIFTIFKAQNHWVSTLVATDIYVGDDPDVFAEAISGNITYLYYKNEQLSELADMPLSVGKFYVVAQADESENYLAVTSEAESFLVLEILPVEFKIEFNEPLVAMKKLSEFSLNAYFVNNNGSVTDLSADDLTVEYENGDFLRASDSVIVISVGGFSLTLDINVEKALIEIPCIDSVVYNGKIQLPKELMSPLYITDFTGAKDAGEYKILLSLVDSENYAFTSDNVELNFVILKAPITLAVKKSGADYELTEGVIFEGDELYEEYYEEDGKIYIRISNPNYDLTVIPREEKNGALYVLILFLIAVVVVFASIGLYITFTKREKNKVSACVGSSREGKTVKKQERKIEDENKKTASKEEPPLETLLAVDESHANNLISDSVAKSLITDEDTVIKTNGRRRYILNLDTISENFSSGDSVSINDFKKKGLLPPDAKYVKILARGVIDKPINIRANAFSLSAVKMIALTGGSAKRVRTVRIKK